MRLYLRLQRAQTNPKVHHIKHVLRYWFKLRARSFWLERLRTRPVLAGSIWPDSKSGQTRNIVIRLDTARNEKVSIRAFLSPSRPEMEIYHRMSGMKTNQIWVKHQDPLNLAQEEKPKAAFGLKPRNAAKHRAFQLESVGTILIFCTECSNPQKSGFTCESSLSFLCLTF